MRMDGRMGGKTVKFGNDYEKIWIRSFPGGSTLNISANVDNSITDDYEIDLLELLYRLGFSKQDLLSLIEIDWGFGE